MEARLHRRLYSGGRFSLRVPCCHRPENYCADKPRDRTLRSKRLCRDVKDDGRLVVSVVFGRHAQPAFSVDRRDPPRPKRRRILRTRKTAECGARDFRDGGCRGFFRLPCWAAGGLQCFRAVLAGGSSADLHLLRCRADLSGALFVCLRLRDAPPERQSAAPLFAPRHPDWLSLGWRSPRQRHFSSCSLASASSVGCSASVLETRFPGICGRRAGVLVAF